MAELKDCDNIFDYDNCVINKRLIDEKLKKMSYSLQLVEVLNQMLSIDEITRPDFIQLEKIFTNEFKLANRNQVL